MLFTVRQVAADEQVQTGQLVSATWQPTVGTATRLAGHESALLCGFLYQHGVFRLWNAVSNEHWTFHINAPPSSGNSAATTSGSSSTHSSLPNWTSARIMAPDEDDCGRFISVAFVGADPRTVYVAVIDLQEQQQQAPSDSRSGGGGGQPSPSSILLLETPLHKGFVTCCETRNLGANEFLTGASDGVVRMWRVTRASTNQSMAHRRTLRLQRKFVAGSSSGCSRARSVQAIAAHGSTVVVATTGLHVWVFQDPDKRPANVGAHATTPTADGGSSGGSGSGGGGSGGGGGLSLIHI